MAWSDHDKTRPADDANPAGTKCLFGGANGRAR